jgi:SMP-30/Gluconolactonase/LRE-like region
MKTVALLAAALALGGPAALPQAAAAAQPAAAPPACAPVGDLNFVCGPVNVEDLLPVDGGKYLVGGSFKAGSAGLYLIDTAARTYKTVAISIAAKPDAGEHSCPAPDIKTLSTHGLDVRAGKGGTATVYAVDHRADGRDVIDLFRLNPAKVSAEWTGCVMTPPGTSANSVVGLADGSIVITRFFDTTDKGGIGAVMAGKVTGLVYHWVPGKGIAEVPGTRLSGDNGLVASPDGKTLYINAYGTKEVWRVPLSGQGERRSVKVDFNPDNVRWAPDGKIFVTGQYLDAGNLRGPNAWTTVVLDPATMTVIPLVKEPGLKQFDNGTTAVQVGRTLWFGAFRGDRIAYKTLP